MKPTNKPIHKPRLFGAREDWQHNACINYIPDKWDIYTIGYKEAADVLVEYIDENRFKQDLLVYPIVFMYRHYIELRLKNLLIDCNKLKDIDIKIPKDHRLTPLWKSVRKLLEEIFPDEDHAPLKESEKIIIEFDKVDPDSFAFRYPVNVAGVKNLEDLNIVNILQFRDRLWGVIDLLEGATCAIGEYLTYKSEMESSSY